MNRIDLTKSISPFSLIEKIRRLLWTVMVWPTVRWLPRAGSPLRVIALRLCGARVGRGCLIERGVLIWLPWRLELSDFVTLGRDVEIYNHGQVSIGAMTVISQYTYLCTSSHDYTHPHMPLIWKNISIGSECWVAADVFVGPGVTIGDRTVVAARSVVVKPLPAQMVCGGHPCRVLKERVIDDFGSNIN